MLFTNPASGTRMRILIRCLWSDILIKSRKCIVGDRETKRYFDDRKEEASGIGEQDK